LEVFIQRFGTGQGFPVLSNARSLPPWRMDVNFRMLLAEPFCSLNWAATTKSTKLTKAAPHELPKGCSAWSSGQIKPNILSHGLFVLFVFFVVNNALSCDYAP
jgi:hypothetical protein